MAMVQYHWYHVGKVHHPFESNLVGIAMFTGVRDFNPWPYVQVSLLLHVCSVSPFSHQAVSTSNPNKGVFFVISHLLVEPPKVVSLGMEAN